MTVLLFDDNQADDTDAFIGSARVSLADLISGDIVRRVCPVTVTLRLLCSAVQRCGTSVC